MTLTSRSNKFLAFAFLATNLLSQLSTQWDGRAKLAISAAAAGAAAVLQVVAQYRNPDGTPAEEPWNADNPAKNKDPQ